MDKEILHTCEKCGKPTLIRIRSGIVDNEIKVLCDCEVAKQEEYKKNMEFEENQRHIDRLKNLSLMDKKLKSVCIDNYFVNEDNQKAFSIAKRYIEKFEDMYEKNQGLIFWGDVGTGKSFTAAVIANELLQRKNSVIMTSFIKVINELKDEEYLNKLNNAKLLIVDDFGAERCTDYVLEKVYNIIDSRYRSGKPLILTTNIDLNEMKNCEDIRYSRIYDRIFEMCYPIKLVGKSWRKKEAVKRWEDMKKILEE